MSILEALRVQKMNQRSVSDLTALPQNEIIRLAQMGHIPADVVPVILSEKAKMAKEMANMQAARQVQQGMPTVIEQAMQTNAADEAPQQMPQAPQRPPEAAQQPPEAVKPGGGLEGLPTGQMFNEQNFRSGGIVAFSGADQSWVQDPGGMYVAADEVQPSSAAEDMQGYIRRFQDLTRTARTETPEEQAYMAAIKKGNMSPEDMRQQKWMRVLQAGLGIMGGKSQYGLANVAEGVKPAVEGYASDLKDRRLQTIADLKTAADTARTRRQEELQDILGGAKLYESELDRRLRKENAENSQLGAKYAENYLAKQLAMGDPRSKYEILDEGYGRFFREYGFASGRAATQAGIAAGAQGVQAAGVTERYVTQAQDSVDKVLSKTSSPESLKYRKLVKTDPEAANKYRQDLIDQRARELASAAESVGGRLPGGAPSAAPAAAAPAASAPKREPAASSTLPPEAASQLKEGFLTRFRNGQEWTLVNGQPKRVK